jgi:hypothetical protein
MFLSPKGEMESERLEGNRMRLFTATLATETNTFSPLPTSIENYRESVFFGAGEHPADAPRMCTAPLFVGRAIAGWKRGEGKRWVAKLPAGKDGHWRFTQLFVNGKRQTRARLPDTDVWHKWWRVAAGPETLEGRPRPLPKWQYATPVRFPHGAKKRDRRGSPPKGTTRSCATRMR